MPKQIQFTKMHGLGNDFIVINNLDQGLSGYQLPVSILGNRFTGVGFDQLLLIEPSTNADFFCRIFNADGSEAEQCGNGLRCVARYIHEHSLHSSPSFLIETKAGVFPIQIKDYDHITVTMGKPEISATLTELRLSTQDSKYTREVSIISVGNPHAILRVNTVESINVASDGAAIAAHSSFPHGANVGFMEIINPEHIRLRTFERGVGETHACGSNACAAAVAGIINGWLSNQVTVDFRYGSLMIQAEKNSSSVNMTGPAASVFTGKISLSDMP